MPGCWRSPTLPLGRPASEPSALVTTAHVRSNERDERRSLAFRVPSAPSHGLQSGIALMGNTRPMHPGRCVQSTDGCPGAISRGRRVAAGWRGAKAGEQGPRLAGDRKKDGALPAGGVHAARQSRPRAAVTNLSRTRESMGRGGINQGELSTGE